MVGELESRREGPVGVKHQPRRQQRDDEGGDDDVTCCPPDFQYDFSQNVASYSRWENRVEHEWRTEMHGIVTSSSVRPFSFPSNALYAPFAPLTSDYGQNSHEHAANYHSLYHTRHLWNAVSPAAASASLTPPQDGMGASVAGSPGALWTQPREARQQPLPPPPPPPQQQQQQQMLSQITVALATPSPLSSAGSNEESEASALSLNNAAANDDLCEDDDDPGILLLNLALRQTTQCNAQTTQLLKRPSL